MAASPQTKPAPDAVTAPTFADVEAAARRIAGVAHRTPVLTSRTADARTGATLFFKAENLQRAGAFKFRGAYNAIAALADDAEAARRRHLSRPATTPRRSRYAGQLLGVPTVRSSCRSDAPAMKVAATRGYGAEVVFYDRYTEDREAIGRELAADARPDPDPALRPCGRHRRPGHGRAASCSRRSARSTCCWRRSAAAACSPAARSRRGALSPGCRVIGVEPEAGNDGQQSLPQGRGGAHPGAEDHRRRRPDHLSRRAYLRVIRQAVADIVTVTDAALVDDDALLRSSA